MNVQDGTTELTVESASAVFESFLSDEENRKEDETPPAQAKTSEPEQPEPEASEQAEEKGESEETEQTEETPAETPASSTIDPNTKVRVKIDGQEMEVTLEEALKGYSRTQDYTRKTQELAENRKRFEAEELPAVRAERQRLAQSLTQLEQALQEATPKEPDWDRLRQENPTEFAAVWAQWQQHKQDMDAIRYQREQAELAVAADNQRALQTHLERERELLLEAVPEWKDVKVASEEKTKLVAFAKDAGYSVEEIGQVTDHRAIKLLRDAMKYRESLAKKPAVQARIERVMTAKPGTGGESRPPVSQTTRALQRLAKTGRVDDAAAAFESMLPD